MIYLTFQTRVIYSIHDVSCAYLNFDFGAIDKQLVI